MRSLRALILALVLLALAAPAGARAGPRDHRDQAAALRATTSWLAIYSPRVWIGVELPGRCRALPSGSRSCPIAIRLLAWTAGALTPWRCVAQAVLPAPTSRAEHSVRRTSAHCTPLPDIRA
jgi:hypothetical protein